MHVEGNSFWNEEVPQTCPSVCLLLPFAEIPTRLLSTELVEPENLNSYLN